MVRRVSATVRVDHGARGQANQARPQQVIETIAAGITTKVYLDDHLIDRLKAMAQISDRQHGVAERVLMMHDEAGFEPSVCAGYAPSGWGRGHDDETDEAAGITRFRALLGAVSADNAFLLHAMCLGQHPSVMRLAALQAVLTGLGDRWGF